MLHNQLRDKSLGYICLITNYVFKGHFGNLPKAYKLLIIQLLKLGDHKV